MLEAWHGDRRRGVAVKVRRYLSYGLWRHTGQLRHCHRVRNVADGPGKVATEQVKVSVEPLKVNVAIQQVTAEREKVATEPGKMPRSK